jgi:hypothetical protein
MRKMISLIFAAGLLASGFAAAAETIGTVHVGGRHGGGGGRSGNGHVVRGGGGGNRAGHFRNGGGIRYGVGVGLGVPYYAGDPGVDSYGGYADSGDNAAPADPDPGAYGSDDAPADAPVSPVLYYCDNPQGYYPDVTTCNDDWQPVQAAPPADSGN